jgi:hypothetical protein
MNPITEMRKLLGPNGENWCQGAWVTPDGKMCLSGAARVALGGAAHLGSLETREQITQWDRINKLVRSACRKLFPGADDYGFVTINDEPRRSWQDIDLILKHAEAKWEEQESAGD